MFVMSNLKTHPTISLNIEKTIQRTLDQFMKNK